MLRRESRRANLEPKIISFPGNICEIDFGVEASENEILRSLVFVFIFNVFNTVVGLPFSVYSTFVVEQRHGFNNQTVGFYVKDQIKKFVVSQVSVARLRYWPPISFRAPSIVPSRFFSRPSCCR